MCSSLGPALECRTLVFSRLIRSCHICIEMDPIVALSLACNVLTVVDFCVKTAALASNIRQKGSLDPDLAVNAERIQTLSSQLENSIQNASLTLHSQGSHQELLTIAADSREASKKLLLEMNNILNSRGGVVVKLFKAFARSSQFKKLETTLSQLQQTLHTGLLKTIWRVCTSLPIPFVV